MAPRAEAPNLIEWTGRFQREIYRHGEFAVFVALDPDGKAVVVTGEAVPPATRDAPLHIVGQWTEHPKYGRQFAAWSVTVAVPATAEAVQRYLETARIPGIGTGWAARIVAALGPNALERILHDPHVLESVPGLGTDRAARVAEQVRTQHSVAQQLVWLYQLGLGRAVALKAQRRWGAEAQARILANPYLLMELPGVGLETADQVAAHLGWTGVRPERVRAVLHATLQDATAAGHVALPDTEWLRAAEATLRQLDAKRGGPPIDAEERAAAVRREARALLQGQQVYRDGSYVYLPHWLHLEQQAARELARLAATPPAPVAIPWDALIRRTGIAYTPEQRAAITHALQGPVALLTGGPGTGKTTVIRGVLAAWAALGGDARAVVLAAPTGRAAQRMSEVTGHPAQTLHRLLQWQPDTGAFFYGPDNPLEVALCIVDEVSMVDLAMASALLAALPTGVRLVWVGDQDQLPSVGAGAVLRDALRAGCLPTVRLHQVHRQAEASGIVTNAHRLLRGLAPEPRPDCTTVYLPHPVEPAAAHAALWDLLQTIGERGWQWPDQVQVLTPMRRGTLGTRALNAFLQEHGNPLPPGALDFPGAYGQRFRVGDRVMQIRNNYAKGVVNGELGIVGAIEAEADTPDVPARCVVWYDRREVVYTEEDIDEIALAYATTIHKSQGSEFPVIVVAVLWDSRILLRRNLIYTALTRAREAAWFLTQPGVLEFAARNGQGDRRHTQLATRLAAALATAPREATP